jgi:NTP-dependent ternary system trypsin peptidase co-occuring protein
LAYLVEFPTEGGGSILVEVEREGLAGFQPASVNPGEVAAKATGSVQAAMDKLLPTVNAIGDRVKTLAPDECTVALGVKLTAEAGVIVSKATGEANFTITLKWNKAGDAPGS